MARIRIVTDTVLTTCVNEAGPTDTYIEVPDQVWRNYQNAQAALEEAEAALSAYNLPENRVNPADEWEW